MNKKNVLSMQGGGGSRSTGKSRALDPNVILNNERTEAQSENVKQNCHAELDSASIQHCVLSVTLARFRNKFGMTLKEMTLVCAFTMAEILLSLTIIGVVAAITLPSLTGNINERTWNTQRKALYARMSQAIALMPALNGYGTLTEETSSGANDGVDTAAETFVTEGLSKVLKINNICDSENLEDCGIPVKLTPMIGSIISPFPKTLKELNTGFTAAAGYSFKVTNTKVAAFETQNGESIALFYNPKCQGKSFATREQTVEKVCANFIYDLNGNKGPNTVGKDIGFITAFYPTDPVVVAPLVLPWNSSSNSVPLSEVGSFCKEYSDVGRAPNVDEVGSMFINYRLLGEGRSFYYASISPVDVSKVWIQDFYVGHRVVSDKTATGRYRVRCVKR